MTPKPKILIVDDDDRFRTILEKTLSAEGYEIKTVANGEEALELVAREHFNLILIDLIMPRKDGFQTIESLMENNPEISLIAMSGGRNGSQSYLRVAGKIAACRTLAKPFNREALLEAIRSAIGG